VGAPKAPSSKESRLKRKKTPPSTGRKRPTASTQDAVLIASKRRCSLCFGLRGDLSEKLHGQLAHIDHDHSNSIADNLCYLCLLHHDAYDTRSIQSKNLTVGELRFYRDKLYNYLRDSSRLTTYYAPQIGRPLESAPFFTLIGNSVSARFMDLEIRNDAAAVTCLEFDVREDTRNAGAKVERWYPSSLSAGETLQAKVEVPQSYTLEYVFVMRVRDRGGLERTYELHLNWQKNGPPRFDFIEVA
jgi:hypothetical protein